MPETSPPVPPGRPGGGRRKRGGDMLRERGEARDLLRQAVGRFRRLFIKPDGLHIGEAVLANKLDSDGNQDPHWQRRDGTEANLTDATDLTGLLAVEYGGTGLTEVGPANSALISAGTALKYVRPGIDNHNFVRIDVEGGATEGHFPRFTEEGMESLSATSVLEALSGTADDPFDWNDQQLRNIRKLFIGTNRVEARWHHAITVEDPAADDDIPIIYFFDGRTTLTDVKDATIGSSTTADYNLEWRDTLNGTGTDVFASDVQATTTDAHRKTEDFQSPHSGSTGGWLVLAISAVSGTAPDFLAVTLRGTYTP